MERSKQYYIDCNGVLRYKPITPSLSSIFGDEIIVYGFSEINEDIFPKLW